jgi:hypothetical protein
MFSFLQLLNACGLCRKQNGSAKRLCAVRPRLEFLEGRWTPTSVTVTSTNSTGAGTLDAAIGTINGSSDPTNSISLTGISGTINLPGQEIISKNVDITGPGAGSLTISRDTTVGARQFRLLFINTSTTVTITGVTLANGVGPAGGSGGGLANFGTITLTNDDIYNNSAPDGGGLFNASTGSMTLSGTSVVTNTATNTGGGIVTNGNLTLSNSDVTNNSAVNGGGIYISSTGSASLSNNSYIGSNSASSNGGGVYNNGTFTMTGGSITENDTSGDGGGLYNASGTANLTTVAITYNTANEGGGFYAAGGSLNLLTDCTLSNNSASVVGDGGVVGANANYNWPTNAGITDDVE